MTDRAPTRTEIRDLLDRHGLSPSRALGQNFLCDPGTVDKIVRLAGAGPGDSIVEIGAGLGSLTVGLASAGAQVLAVEIDRYLIPALTETVDSLPPERRAAVTIHHGDARSLDWEAHLGRTRWTVVANLPYNIATPLVLDLLATRPEFSRQLVMVQREAGERLVAGPGSRTYGIPSVLRAYWADASVVATVKAELFLPRPKVASVLVDLVRRPTPDADFATMARLVRAGFGQRRKMVRRSLATVATTDQLTAAGIAPTARAEEIGLDRWCALADLVSPAGEAG